MNTIYKNLPQIGLVALIWLFENTRLQCLAERYQWLDDQWTLICFAIPHSDKR